MTRQLRKDIISALIARDGYRCMFPGCTKPFTEDDPPTIDHWLPYSIFKREGLEDLVLMHFACNNIKGNTIPNPDGTLNLTRKSKKIPKARRPEVCEECCSGRLLLKDEVCWICGSGPQPPIFHRAMKKRPKNCKHTGDEWCQHCCIGLIPRRA